MPMWSLEMSLSSRSAARSSRVGRVELAVIIDARLRSLVMAVPTRPRASHQRPKLHDRRKTKRKLSALPMIDVPVLSAGISGQPWSRTRLLPSMPAVVA